MPDEMSAKEYRESLGRQRKHKYGVSPVGERKADGITFDSKKERDYYLTLKLRVADEADELVYFLRQVPFDLPGNTKYRVDFQLFFGLHGSPVDLVVRYIDVKGHETKEFIRAKKQVEALYPVEIEVVK